MFTVSTFNRFILGILFSSVQCTSV